MSNSTEGAAGAAAAPPVGFPGDWIAPVHACEKCGESLNWQECGLAIAAVCQQCGRVHTARLAAPQDTQEEGR